MSLAANSWDAAGLAGEVAAGEMVADMALGLAVAHLDLDRLSCPNGHRILALGVHVRRRTSGASPKLNRIAQGSLPSCSMWV